MQIRLSSLHFPDSIILSFCDCKGSYKLLISKQNSEIFYILILISVICLHYFCIKIVSVCLLIQSCCGLPALSLCLLHIIYNASALCRVAVRKNKKHLCREMLKSVRNLYITPLKTRGFLFKTFRVRKYGKNRRFAIF